MSSWGPLAPRRTFSAMSSAGSSSDRSYAVVAARSANTYDNTAAHPTSSNSAGIRKDSNRRLILFGRPPRSGTFRFPQVSEPAHRADADAFGLDLGAQPRDVDFDGVEAQCVVVVDELLRDLLLAEYSSRPREKELEQRPFPNRQIDGNVVHPDALHLGVDGQSAKREGARGSGRTAQQRTHARFEFGDRERLGQIVVGAEIETVHAIIDRVASGQHEDIGARPPQTKPAQHFESVDVGQADVEDDEFVRWRAQQVVGLNSRCRAVDRMSAAIQDARKPGREQRIVFNDENAHEPSRAAR